MVALYPLLYAVLMGLINPSMYFSWYFLPLMPGLLILMMASIWFGPIKSRKIRLMFASGMMVCLIIFPAYLLNKFPNWPLSRAREEGFMEVCSYLADEDLRGKLVLTPDIGVLGWCLEAAAILDPIGLVSPESISYVRDLPSGQLVSPELVSDMQPDYVISLDQFINPYLLEDTDFQSTYQLLLTIDVKIVQTVQPIYVFRRCSECLSVK